VRPHLQALFAPEPMDLLLISERCTSGTDT
jgi:hypothetical protein